MRLATIRAGGTTRAVKSDGDVLVDLGAVGLARRPPRFLAGGETVVAEIEGLGRCENRVVKEGAQ